MVDPLSLNPDTIAQLETLLQIDHSIDNMKPQESEGTNLLNWLLNTLRENFHMLNSRLVHCKTMIKSNKFRDKNEQFILSDTVSRSR